MPAVVRVVEEIKNAVGSCDWASPPVVDLRLGMTADDSLVVVIRELVHSAKNLGKKNKILHARCCV